MSDSDKPTAVDRPPRRPDDGEVANAPTQIKSPQAPGVTLPDKPGARVRDRPSAPPSRYVPGDEIARGGMGRVALATDTLLERVVAVKQALTLDPEMLRRFARETKITARLEHPSIVPVYDAGIDGDAPFYVMRRVSGRPLSELILASSTLDARLALVPNLLAAAQAVAHAHARGIVHRDIKPANILVGDFGETIVIDWGLAKVIGETDDDDPAEVSAGDSLRTRAGTVFGTPGFMSPGQLRGDPVGPAADVYALGASLYFMLAGRPPHLAKTGDAMMALAAEGPPEPLAKLVPGVPRELVTIVDTALAYGPASYRDASELVEELRRYTTGQLVASHHYSRWARMLRFIRRNRAAVAIALVACIVIAAGATLSIRRVIEERDRADDEARQAEAAQRNAQERTDQLLLLRAGTQLEVNPTEAFALLAELDPASPRNAEAHGIANAAILKGIPRAIQGPNTVTAMVELDATGSRMLQATLDGNIHVWDLVRGTELAVERFQYGVRGTWVGPKILVNGTVKPALFDPDTGSVQPLGLPMLSYVEVSPDLQLILGETDADHQLVRIDLAAQTATPVWPGHKLDTLAMAGDGSWFAMHDSKELIAMSRDGRELARRTGAFSLMRGSRSKRLGVVDRDELFELELGSPAQTWKRIDTSKFSKLITTFTYRGEELLVGMGSGHLLALRDGQFFELARPSAGVTFSHAAGDEEHLFATGNSGALYLSWLGVRTIKFPHPMSTPRIAARIGVRRFAVTSNDTILVYDIDQFAPIQIATKPNARAHFFDDDTLLLTDSYQVDVWWRDLATGRETTIATRLQTVNRDFAFDAEGGTAIMDANYGQTSELYRLRKHSSELTRLYQGPAVASFQVVRGGDVVYAVGPRVTVLVRDTPREALTFEHPAREIVTHERRFAVISQGGELARGDVDSARLDRDRIEPPPPPLRLAPNNRLLPPVIDADRAGTVYAGWGTAIWKWSDRVEKLADVAGAILDVRVVGDQLLVMMLANRLALVEIATGKVHALPSHGGHVLFSPGFDAVAMDVGGYYRFLDPASRTTWPTPIPRLGLPFDMSSSGRRIVMRAFEKLYLWTMPGGSGPIRPRVETYTNATISKEGFVAWPWQR